MRGPNKTNSKPAVLILAGGLGTRLREVNPDLPKPMVSVLGKPFLHWLVSSLYQQGFRHFIFSIGYKAEAIENYAWSSFFNEGRFEFVIEKSPLGTGGAVVEALNTTTLPPEASLWVINGDTLLEDPLPHPTAEAAYTVLKPEQVFDALHNIQADQNRVIDAHGLNSLQGSHSFLDAGAVFLPIGWVKNHQQKPPFSLHELLKGHIEKREVGFCILKGTCYDIGTPDRLKRFEAFLKSGRIKI